MPLLTHAAWGALFCSVGGDCSAETLQFATLTASGVGLVAAYLLGWTAGLPRASRLLLVAALAANPIYYALSFTFMTDVTFTTLVAAAAIFYVRALRDESGLVTNLAVAIVITVVAALDRQLAIFLPLAYGAAIVVTRTWSWQRIALAAVAFGAPVVAMAALNIWMARLGVTPAYYAALSGKLMDHAGDLKSLAHDLVFNGLTILGYLGLFSLPMLLRRASLRTPQPRWLVRLAWGAGALAALAIAMFAALRGPMPFGGNILTSSGVGPYVLAPYPKHLALGGGVDEIEHFGWWLATLAAVAGAGLLAFRLTLTVGYLLLHRRDADARGDRAVAAFFILGAGVYMAPLLIAGFYDRYLLPLLLLVPLFDAALGRDRPARWALPSGVALGVAFAVVSISWTHDYLAWNRARAEAVATLTAQHVAPDEISGGFELYGQQCFEHTPECPMATFLAWESRDPAFTVAFQPLPGKTVKKVVTYGAWLPFGRRSIYVLRRPTS